MHHKGTTTQRGNVLVIIFVTIALFAALIFAITQDTKSSGKNTSRDPVFAAAEIVGYAGQIGNAVDAMMLNGTDLEDISFENGLTADDYSHSPAVTDNDKIFHASGGGVTYISPSESWLDASFSAMPLYQEWGLLGNACVANIGTGDANCHTDGSSNSEDLVLFLTWIDKSVCLAINRKVGIPPCGSDACLMDDDTSGYVFLPYTGTFADGGVAFGKSTGEFDYKHEGCTKSADSGIPFETYSYYKVLVPR